MEVRVIAGGEHTSGTPGLRLFVVELTKDQYRSGLHKRIVRNSTPFVDVDGLFICDENDEVFKLIRTEDMAAIKLSVRI